MEFPVHEGTNQYKAFFFEGANVTSNRPQDFEMCARTMTFEGATGRNRITRTHVIASGGETILRSKQSVMVVAALAVVLVTPSVAQRGGGNSQAEDPVKTLVGRLGLDRYKTTLRSLAQFGDRRQGTERNRKAVDWIEAQLKSYGCTNVERTKYTYTSAPAQPAPADTGARGGQRGAPPAGPQRGQAARGQGGVERSAKVIERVKS
jgi:hypothetical protein